MHKRKYMRLDYQRKSNQFIYSDPLHALGLGSMVFLKGKFTEYSSRFIIQKTNFSLIQH